MLPIPIARLSKVPAFPHVRQFVRPQRLTSAICVPYPLTQSRKMSTAPKKEFLCILPDKPGVQAKRLEVRP